MKLWISVIYFACLLLRGQCKNVMVIGGGTMTSDLFDKFVEISGESGQARIGTITAASSDPIDSAIYYRDQFTQHGAQEVYWIPVHMANLSANSDPGVVSNVRRMTGFFFGGGDQAAIVASLFLEGRVDSPVLAAMREVYNGGGTVAMGGTSAGAAAIASTPMITSGYSWEALIYGPFVIGDPSPDYALEYAPLGGVGMLDGFIVDTHFSERGREGRLVRLLHDTMGEQNGASRGLGVDEQTALVITDEGTSNAVGEVVGRGGVFIPDVSGATAGQTNGYYSLRDVYADYLTYQDIWNITSGQVTYPSWKTNVAGSEDLALAPTSNIIFIGEALLIPEFTMVATGLFNSRDSTTIGRTEEEPPEYIVQYQVDFSKVASPDAEAYRGDAPNNNEQRISYRKLWLDFYAIP